MVSDGGGEGWRPSLWSHRRSLTQHGERRWRRGMAAIPLVNPSELSSGMGGHPRLVGMAAGENRPGDTRELIGERDRQQVAMQAPGCLLDPRPETAPGGRWSPH